MLRHPYVRSVVALALALLSTCAFALLLWTLLLMMLPQQTFPSTPVGLGLFAASVAFAAASVRFFAEAMLFEKQDPAPLQIIGAVRFGSFLQAVASAKGATWPFAKLSASLDAIRLQTPFGSYAWDKSDTRTDLWQTTSRNLAIGADTEPILFIALPWQRGRLARSLQELGY